MNLAYPNRAVALDRIRDIGIEEAPNEACGVLIDEAPHGVRVVQLRNRADDPTTGYRIDPQTLRTLSLAPDHWANVIVWHTHPRGTVGPSSGDLEYKIPGVNYVVVAVPTGEAVFF